MPRHNQPRLYARALVDLVAPRVDLGNVLRVVPVDRGAGDQAEAEVVGFADFGAFADNV